MPRVGDANRPPRLISEAIQDRHQRTTPLTAAIVHHAHVTDSVLLCQSVHDAGNTRQLMKMLMPVQMRDAQSAREHTLDLQSHLSLHIPSAREKKTQPVFRHALAVASERSSTSVR